ncbi:MAG TPA: helix-turn-helix transcriptional regulator [Polyangia bacterium]|nr:helix-turn-helix transcriptional regulator [Polyangia bacterium]
MEMHENKNAAEAKQPEREREHDPPEPAVEHARSSGEDQKEAKAGSPAPGTTTARAAVHGKPKQRKNNLRKLRLERMMSKAELARRAGVSTLTIDRVERGMSCRMDTKRKILEALGLRPSDRVTVFGEDE